MTSSSANARLDDLIRRYAGRQQDQEHAPMRRICIAAILFSALGILFAINFGLSLIAVAIAILYYNRFGQRVAAEMGAMFLLMLAAWMILSIIFMPAHHLAAASFGMFVLALAGWFFGPISDRQGKLSLSGFGRDLQDDPIYLLVMIRERLLKNPRLDPR
jgi:uncharacterized membrane protein YGL010W